MQIILNGQTHSINTSITVTQLLAELSLEGKFAIEINEEIIPCSSYDEFQIKPGDRIEVVNAVGGG